MMCDVFFNSDKRRKRKENLKMSLVEYTVNHFFHTVWFQVYFLQLFRFSFDNVSTLLIT